MNLSYKGITVEVQSPIEIARLKKAGYKEPEVIPVPETKEPEKPEGEKAPETEKAPKEPKKAGK